MSANPFTTTKLLTVATDRLTATLPHRRNRVAVLAIAVSMALLIVAGAVTNWRAPARPAVAAPQLVIIFQTVTPAATPRPQSTPLPVVIFQTVEVPYTVERYIEVPAPPVDEPPAPTATVEEWHPPLVYGEVRGWDGEVESFTSCGGPDVAPPLCH